MLQPPKLSDKPITKKADLSELVLHGTAVGWSLDDGATLRGQVGSSSKSNTGSASLSGPNTISNPSAGTPTSSSEPGDSESAGCGASDHDNTLPCWESFTPTLLKIFEIQTVKRAIVVGRSSSCNGPDKGDSDGTREGAASALTSVRSIHLYEWTHDPAIVEYRDFLAPDECTTAISLANEFGWAPSKTSIGKAYSTQESYSSTQSRNRTSFTAAIHRMEHPFFIMVEKRMAQLLRVPLDTLEALTVLRYHPGQEFKVHHDGDFRYQTVLIYLNDVEEGGGTAFPALRLIILPKQGMALSWQNSKSDGSAHMGTLHAGLPVTRGVKYCIPIFVNKKRVR